MAKPMTLRDLSRRLLAHGCVLRHGKGDHIVVTRNGALMGTLRSGQKMVGPGTVISFERNMGVDLDDHNIRPDRQPLNVPVAAPLPASPRPARLIPKPTEVAAEGAPKETQGNAKGMTRAHAPGSGAEAPRTAAPLAVSTPPAATTSIADLEALLELDPKGISLRKENGEVILVYTDVVKGKKKRAVIIAKDLVAVLARVHKS